MPTTREDIVHAVAVLLARHRQGQAFADYRLTDAVEDNDLGWVLEHIDGVVRLEPDEIDQAWSRSNRILRAWA